jgi:hypothetical protein
MAASIRPRLGSLVKKAVLTGGARDGAGDLPALGAVAAAFHGDAHE